MIIKANTLVMLIPMAALLEDGAENKKQLVSQHSANIEFATTYTRN